MRDLELYFVFFLCSAPLYLCIHPLFFSCLPESSSSFDLLSIDSTILCAKTRPSNSYNNRKAFLITNFFDGAFSKQGWLLLVYNRSCNSYSKKINIWRVFYFDDVMISPNDVR